MFSFKQFTIHQDRTAMKVCTDACVLGAYADVGQGAASAQVRGLDIGTGTGLLALMAAQRNPRVKVDAVEVDDSAFGQATENVANSPFADRVRVWHSRIQDFEPSYYYDRILTNPPFYTNHLRSPDKAVNRALHTDELPFDELLTAVVRLLKPNGEWWVLLPPQQMDDLIISALHCGLYPVKQLMIRHNAQKPVFRVVTGFTFRETNTAEELLSIHELDNQVYTAEFRTLLRDFYLLF